MKEQKEEEKRKKRGKEKLEGLIRPRKINTACLHDSRKQKNARAFLLCARETCVKGHALAVQHTCGKPDLLKSATPEALGQSTAVCGPQHAGHGRGWRLPSWVCQCLKRPFPLFKQ